MRRCGLRDRHGVADVVAVAVGEQDRGGVELIGGDRGLGVAGQERVDQHRAVAVGQLEGGVAVVTDFHVVLVLQRS